MPSGSVTPGGGGSQPHAALIYRNGSGHTSGPISGWTGVDFDTDGFAAVDGSGFTVPAGLGGAYLFTIVAALAWTDPPTDADLYLNYNPEPVLFNPAFTCHITATGPVTSESLALSAMGRFAAGDSLAAGLTWNGGTGVGGTGQFQYGITYLGAVA